MNWIEFVSVGDGLVRCPLCEKLVGVQRIARGAHAAWHFKQRRWFFDDDTARANLRIAADDLAGTPFVKFSRAVGPRGGIDCVGGVEFLMSSAGVVAPGEFEFARTSDDYQGHGAARKILRYLTGRHPDPQSQRLAQRFEKIAVFRELRRIAKSETPTNLDESLFMPGDILVLRHADLFHLPVMLTPRTFISVIPHAGATIGDLHDRQNYTRHLVALFRAKRV